MCVCVCNVHKRREMRGKWFKNSHTPTTIWWFIAIARVQWNGAAIAALHKEEREKKTQSQRMKCVGMITTGPG